MVLGALSLHLWTSSLHLMAERAPQFLDITTAVQDLVERSGVRQGIAVVFSRHTTAAIKINEHEPELIKDMEQVLTRVAPADAAYFHNDFTVRTVNMEEDECPNGHAHCQHLFLSTSETIPIANGRLALGPWQSVFMVELDRPREREVVVQLLGA